MKLSQAVDLYIQRKRDAGMRFDSPTNILRSFLRHCGDIDLHHITVQQVTAFLDGSGSNARWLDWQARHAAVFFRLLDSAWSAEILSGANHLLPKLRKASFRTSTRDPIYAHCSTPCRAVSGNRPVSCRKPHSAPYCSFCMQLACGWARRFGSGSWMWI
jgi:hypothetical protein